jgi:hypothetical protein
MDATGPLPRGNRLGLRLKVVLALYVLAAALLPFTHHDLACHLKSTTHCTTCIVGSSAEVTAAPAVPGRLWLADAGAAIADPITEPRSATVRPTSGRAPPAAA